MPLHLRGRMRTMYRLLSCLRISIVFGVLLFATTAFAALPPAYYTNNALSVPACTPVQPCSTSGKIITFYVPHSAPNCATSIEGCIATSKPGLDGKAEPISVDAVRLGKAKYATCASDPSNYGKYFNIGTVTYRSALDMQMYTVPNLICYVHDTGGAFRGRPDKLDLATTLCPTCTDTEAGKIGVGGTVNLAGTGPVDANANASVYNSALLNMNASTIGTPTGGGTGTQAPAVPARLFSIGQQIAQLFSPSQSAPIQNTAPVQNTGTSPANPQALLIAQPASVKRGNPVLLSWSSVGMSSQTPCQISENGQSLAQKNTGSYVVQTASLPIGTLGFVLSCTTAAGLQVQQSAFVSVN